MKSVYIETSILSYLTARPSANLVSAARQRLTCDWWDNCRSRFELYISPLVEIEACRGDPSAAARRLAAMDGLPSLAINARTAELASLLLREGALPPKAEDDAAHVSLAAIHGMDYLLTWNCRHIDNAEMKPVSGRSVPYTASRARKSAHRRNCSEISTMKDEVLSELWEAKDSVARESNYSIDALMIRLKEAQSSSSRKVVDLSRNKPPAPDGNSTALHSPR